MSEFTQLLANLNDYLKRSILTIKQVITLNLNNYCTLKLRYDH